ncbi:hypothetical protein XPR_1431 [Xanthomonas arboricola pv. pruni MAFF 301420]|uniref:Uncharacterized protein n=2 Tax=Xanthomonas arboricola pv. pruni TaxID=69929 RepID=W4SE53_9XANT|nr:PilY1 protein [Xanthomonas arboricola pv. pruni str. MAFF 311562]GAE54796.1 hypothetical protein XPR_1431 [Xanthomonas arboricola pv. pruni MAFF 301420]GAE60696.1 hypothetical protein XPN_2602 [Xanthomonas arboricola pv. pruni MAFF 301427]
MNISKIPFRRRLDVLRKALRVPMLATLATLLSLPANAGITLPTDPLTTASRVPPNIMFILDDSGSMAFGDLANPDFPTICDVHLMGVPAVRTMRSTSLTIHILETLFFTIPQRTISLG